MTCQELLQIYFLLWLFSGCLSEGWTSYLETRKAISSQDTSFLHVPHWCAGYLLSFMQLFLKKTNKRLSLCSQNDTSAPEPEMQSCLTPRPPRSQWWPFPPVAPRSRTAAPGPAPLPPARRDPPTRRRSPRRW